ncbi:MAG: TFIIB-type zinc ribbon-containing protein [Thermoanaerobaculaceae bacterium]|jgi:uncharacterized C2H2 Zn-finger protein
MLADIRLWVGRISDRFKRGFYGPTFRCPVCHFVLAAVDADGNGLLVCPVCGAVLEIEAVYGHIVPVVLDMELYRPQPKLRLHPMATHLPIGLFPVALLGAVALAAATLFQRLGLASAAPGGRASVLASAVLVLLVLSVGASLATLASGLWDWNFRYRRRSYRQIRLKIVCSIVFLAVGAAAIALHASGLVFAASGLMRLDSAAGLAAGLVYLVALGGNMLVLATLGHVGGTLVFGR